MTLSMMQAGNGRSALRLPAGTGRVSARNAPASLRNGCRRRHCCPNVPGGGFVSGLPLGTASLEVPVGRKKRGKRPQGGYWSKPTSPFGASVDDVQRDQVACPNCELPTEGPKFCGFKAGQRLSEMVTAVAPAARGLNTDEAENLLSGAPGLVDLNAVDLRRRADEALQFAFGKRHRRLWRALLRWEQDRSAHAQARSARDQLVQQWDELETESQRKPGPASLSSALGTWATTAPTSGPRTPRTTGMATYRATHWTRAAPWCGLRLRAADHGSRTHGRSGDLPAAFQLRAGRKDAAGG